MFMCCHRKTDFKAENFNSGSVSGVVIAKGAPESKSSSESSLGVNPAHLTRTKKQLDIRIGELPTNLRIVEEEGEHSSDFSLSV